MWLPLNFDNLLWLAIALPGDWSSVRGEPRMHPKMVATIKCLQEIEKSVTVEHYYDPTIPEEYCGKPIPSLESPQFDLYRVYIDVFAAPHLIGKGFLWIDTMHRVEECFVGDQHLEGHVELFLKTKQEQIIVDCHGDLSQETTHICGDRKQTALRGKDNSKVPYWPDCICGCDPVVQGELIRQLYLAETFGIPMPAYPLVDMWDGQIPSVLPFYSDLVVLFIAAVCGFAVHKSMQYVRTAVRG